MCLHIYIHIYIHIHTYTYTYTYIYIHVLFSWIADTTNTSLLNDRTITVQATHRPSEKKLKTLSNLAQLWIPISKTLILAGIKVDGNIIREEPQLTIAMGAAWQPTFSPKDFNEGEAQEFLESLGDFGTYEDVPPPDEWAMSDTVWSMRDSAPGGDGLPYSSYKGIGLTGVKTLLGADRALRSGVLPPPSFNESVTMFSPKGTQPHDPVEVIREPLKTRPLSLKNTDNKTIVAANVRMLEPQYRKHTHVTQNGFRKGKNFLNNLIDLDAAARIFL